MISTTTIASTTRSVAMIALLGVFATAACAGGSDSSGGASDGPQTSTGGSSSGSIVADASACSDPTSHGCPCTQLGQVGECWTGPADKRHVGSCHDGVTKCVADGEFMTWGLCSGVSLDCTNGSGGGPTGGEDGGQQVDGGGGPGNGPSGAECQCIPGSEIVCDEDCTQNLFCVDMGNCKTGPGFAAVATQTCLPDGTWGPCRERHSDGGRSDGGISLFRDGGISLFSDGGRIFSTGDVTCNVCKFVGLGCTAGTQIGDCNGGKGGYMGDCSAVLKCPAGVSPLMAPASCDPN